MTQSIDKIQLIKFIRHYTKATLMESKNLADAMEHCKLVTIEKGIKVEYMPFQGNNKK